jgi:hypothetical protein
VAALGSADLERLADVLHSSARAGQRAAPVGPLRQLRTAEQLQPGTVLVLRAHLAARLLGRGTGGVVRSRAADLVVSAADVPAVRRLLETGTATTAELGDQLARRLVLGGLVLSG